MDACDIRSPADVYPSARHRMSSALSLWLWTCVRPPSTVPKLQAGPEVKTSTALLALPKSQYYRHSQPIHDESPPLLVSPVRTHVEARIHHPGMVQRGDGQTQGNS